MINTDSSNCFFCGKDGITLKKLLPSKPEYDRGVRARMVCEKCWRENLKA